MLDRLRTLATQSSSATFSDDGRKVANSEFQSLLTEIDRQSQAIGLDTGGQFAKTLNMFHRRWQSGRHRREFYRKRRRDGRSVRLPRWTPRASD